jgi:hypothetical protein
MILILFQGIIMNKNRSLFGIEGLSARTGLTVICRPLIQSGKCRLFMKQLQLALQYFSCLKQEELSDLEVAEIVAGATAGKGPTDGSGLS